MVVTTGHVADCTQLEPVLDAIHVPRKTAQETSKPAETALYTPALPRCDVRGPKLENTCEQLLLTWEAMWSFAEHEAVEPTSSDAERALRSRVIWRKTSFGSQSRRGLRLVARLLTITGTCKKQQRDLLGYLTAAIEAYRLGWTAPALLPCP